MTKKCGVTSWNSPKRLKKRLQHYEPKFLEALQSSYPLNQDPCNKLKTFQKFFGLSDEDIKPIEKPILDRKEAEYKEQLAEQQRKKTGS